MCPSKGLVYLQEIEGRKGAQSSDNQVHGRDKVGARKREAHVRTHMHTHACAQYLSLRFYKCLSFQ